MFLTCLYSWKQPQHHKVLNHFNFGGAQAAATDFSEVGIDRARTYIEFVCEKGHLCEKISVRPCPAFTETASSNCNTIIM